MVRIIHSVFRLLHRLDRVANLAAAKKAGLKVGPGTLLVGRQSFGSEPFLIEIGRDCLITDGVEFITHDGAIQVPLIANGEKILDVYSKKSTFGKVTIGDNVFIGINSILLPQTVISKNSIIAAASVVKGIFPEGVVIGGNPAKVICSIGDYYQKNKDRIIALKSSEDRSNVIKSITA